MQVLQEEKEKRSNIWNITQDYLLLKWRQVCLSYSQPGADKVVTLQIQLFLTSLVCIFNYRLSVLM